MKTEFIQPFHITEAHQCSPPWTFPDISNIEDNFEYIDERFTLVETMLCDHSGFGQDDEPAYSIPQIESALMRHLNDNKPTGIKVAIIDIGPFQLLLAVWR